MARFFTTTVAVATTAVLLALTGCGADDESPERSAFIDDLMAVVIAQNTPEQGCIRDAIDDFSTEDLQLLSEAVAEPEFQSGQEPVAAFIPAELQAKVTDVMDTCVGTSAPTDWVTVDDAP
ncbi:MAG: hypothetical protein JJU45_16215 [Acidimicrobiia bacterium]|nr:hypothetical protein [Acidimicrobiia bacterium]